MQQLLSFVFLLTFATATLSAQKTATPSAPKTDIPEKSDPQAKKVLDKVRKKYESYKTIDAAFSLSIELPGQPKQTQKGTISQEGDKFRLEMDDQIIASDGKSTWVYLKKNKEIQISNTDPKDISDNGFMTPKDLLKRYEKGDFIYAITEKITENKVVLTQIEFKPKDKKSEYSKLRLSIDEKGSAIKSIKAFSKDGGRYTFSVSSLKTNQAFGAGHFSLDPKKYSGVKVVDLRE